MRMNPLGRTGLMVSEICLGSMTWGTQNTAKEAHCQIDMARDRGVNFIDTAEMYPVNPISSETVGRTERIIGLWNEKNTNLRGDVVIATKHSGRGFKHARHGAPISSKTIVEAVEGSLRRLKTEYIDIYQLHWPNRGSYMFRQNWNFDPSTQKYDDTIAHMEDVLGEMEKLVKNGKIRHFGISNESAWGAAQWLRIAQENNLPRAVSIQNEYSLLCRMFDTDLAELSVNEDLGLLAFSPLAAGLLTGKYQRGAVPKASRMSIVPELGGRKTDRAFDAVDEYLDVAYKHDLFTVQMALAWLRTRPFVTSTIIGATSPEQLEMALGSVDVALSKEVIADLDAVHRAHPMPY
ncbi:MAG: aldo/keto reductase [Rhodobacterales bacterium]|nr:aldo/keto reductase [Rhodobacterales bacterium]